MTESTHVLHDSAVKRLAEQYRAKGFEVVVEPRGAAAPEFLGDYTPDLIVRGAEKSYVVEVKVGSRTAHGARFQDIAERVATQPGWEFSLVVVGRPEDAELPRTLLELPEIQDRIARAHTLLVEQNTLDASFLLFWSAVEAALRVLSRRAHLPVQNSPTSALLRELFSAGELSRPQYEGALQFLEKRNRVAHGFSDPLSSEDVEALEQLARDFLNEAQAA